MNEGGFVPRALPVPSLVDLKDNEARVIRTVVKASVWISHHTLPSSLAGFLADGNPVTIIVKAGWRRCKIHLEWSTMIAFLFTAIGFVQLMSVAVTKFNSLIPFSLPAQPVDATQALNLSAGVSNCKVSRGRSFG